MIRIISMFTLLAAINAAHPDARYMSGQEEWNRVTKLEENYRDYGLDAVRGELQRAWSSMFEGNNKHTSNVMYLVQKFLAKLVGEYNHRVVNKVYKNAENEWKDYKIIFGKNYTTTKEEKMRKAIFKENKEGVEYNYDRFEFGEVNYRIKLNHLSDRTSDELQKIKGFRMRNLTAKYRYAKVLHQQNETKYYHYTSGTPVPASVDWRTKGHVTHVKYQGYCSSSYAFAGIGALEAYKKNKTDELTSLSVQNIMDCTWNLGNDGCDGGFMDTVFEYARTNGVEPDDQYLYTANASHNCQWKKEYAVATDKGYLAIPSRTKDPRAGNEVSLQHAIANHGPVAVGIGTKGGFDHYASGIFHPSNCGPVDHSALVVGYGTDKKHGDYWIIKNSFGVFWGDNGYVLMARNKNNMRHVSSHAVFPV